MDAMELHGAVVVVTGGRGGIGSALDRAFGAAGAVVVTTDLPGRGADVDLDVRDLDAQRAVFDAIRSEHGRLDVVVANAGIGVAGLVEDLTDDDWIRSIEVNVNGVVDSVRAGYAPMMADGHGAIVLMASLAGLGPMPLLTPYAMTKHAIVGLAASLRIEAARYGVGVTAVCPGPVETPLLDEKARTEGMNVRRYLTAGGGPAIAADRLAEAVVDGVRRNRALVVPGRAGMLARLFRHSPGVVDRVSARGVRAELAAAHQ
jgi:NAD(P)-dependent dehydrogenase (short-subunit alcohol dehydrogenase family)